MSRLLRLGLLLLCLAPLTGCYNDNPVYPDGSVGDYQLAGDLLSCLPNGDGKVDKNEINFVAGLSANYLVNPGTLAEFDAKGQLLDGQLEWDFSQMQGVVTKLDVNSPRGFWFADKFPRPTWQSRPAHAGNPSAARRPRRQGLAFGACLARA